MSRIRERYVYGVEEVRDKITGILIKTVYGVAVIEGDDRDRPGMVNVAPSQTFEIPATFIPRPGYTMADEVSARMGDTAALIEAKALEDRPGKHRVIPRPVSIYV